MVYNLAIADDRSVASAKGTLEVVDKYQDVLFENDNVELLPPKLIKAIPKNEIASSDVVVFPTDYRFWINLNSEEISNQLRTLVASQAQLTARFIPKVIMFQDGSILK